MLQPRKDPHRKVRIGKNGGKATRCNTVDFGDFGLQSLSNERVTARQIEAARQAMTRYTKRGGKIWIRIFPHTPVSKKPQEVKMGNGKGNPDHYVAKVKEGTVMFEIQGVSEEVAREAFRLAGHKLPVRVRFVKREEV